MLSSEPWLIVAFILSSIGFLVLLGLTMKLHWRSPADPAATLAWIILGVGAASIIIRTQFL